MNSFSPLFKVSILALIMSFGILAGYEMPIRPAKGTFLNSPVTQRDTIWRPPHVANLLDNEEGKLILYGRELIAHTADYLGPRGNVAPMSNGMNCQNCHLDAGTKILGNNYAAVLSTYPKFRARSGGIESVVKRISDCFERSLNGTKPDSSSREMKAMVAYMRWLGQGVPQGAIPSGTGLAKLPYLSRAANPDKGNVVYQAKCQVCHGGKGEGLITPGAAAYVYPPLWGKNSYNDGAGLYRLGAFAGYVKNNMPLGATYQNPQLTDDEAWDLAAFVNSRPRPHKDQSHDWKDISKKPIDSPFGPYTDKFSERQHKFGPFQPIAQARKTSK